MKPTLRAERPRYSDYQEFTDGVDNHIELTESDFDDLLAQVEAKAREEESLRQEKRFLEMLSQTEFALTELRIDDKTASGIARAVQILAEVIVDEKELTMTELEALQKEENEKPTN